MTEEELYPDDVRWSQLYSDEPRVSLVFDHETSQVVCKASNDSGQVGQTIRRRSQDDDQLSLKNGLSVENRRTFDDIPSRFIDVLTGRNIIVRVNIEGSDIHVE